jgi:serine/threonine protein kinase
VLSRCPPPNHTQKHNSCYSFGITIAEILGLGSSPFKGMQNADLVAGLRAPADDNGVPGIIQTLRPDPMMVGSEQIPEALWALVERCCSQSPADRPSMGETLASLTQLANATAAPDVAEEQIYNTLEPASPSSTWDPARDTEQTRTIYNTPP